MANLFAYTIPLRRDGTVAELHAPIPMTTRDVAAIRSWLDWYEYMKANGEAGAPTEGTNDEQ